MEDDGRCFEILRQLIGFLYFGEFSGKYIATIAGFRLSNTITDRHKERDENSLTQYAAVKPATPEERWMT